MVAPLGDSMMAPAPACTSGAISTTSPPRATMWPFTLSPPASAPSPNTRRPASASASLMRRVDAVKPAVSTTAPAPTAMPAGLTSTSLPLELSVPKMADGLLPSTRLIDVLAAVGCAKWVVAPGATPKLCQFSALWAVPAPFCVVMSVLLPWVVMLAAP